MTMTSPLFWALTRGGPSVFAADRRYDDHVWAWRRAMRTRADTLDWLARHLPYDQWEPTPLDEYDF